MDQCFRELRYAGIGFWKTVGQIVLDESKECISDCGRLLACIDSPATWVFISCYNCPLGLASEMRGKLSRGPRPLPLSEGLDSLPKGQVISMNWLFTQRKLLFFILQDKIRVTWWLKTSLNIYLTHTHTHTCSILYIILIMRKKTICQMTHKCW